MVRLLTRPIFFPRIDGSHYNRINFSLTAVRCFDNGYMRKQPVAWKEYCAEHWLKELQESMDRCTGHRDITETLLITVLDTIQSIICLPKTDIVVNFEPHLTCHLGRFLTHYQMTNFRLFQIERVCRPQFQI